MRGNASLPKAGKNAAGPPRSAHEKAPVGQGLSSQVEHLRASGRGRIRTFEGISQQIYSLSRLAASVHARRCVCGFGRRRTRSVRRAGEYAGFGTGFQWTASAGRGPVSNSCPSAEIATPTDHASGGTDHCAGPGPLGAWAKDDYTSPREPGGSVAGRFARVRMRCSDRYASGSITRRYPANHPPSS